MVASESDNRKTVGLSKKLKSLPRQAAKLLLRASFLARSDSVIINLPQPPFPALLRSNIPPTESETSLIRDVIAKAEAEESRLNEMASSPTRSECFMTKFKRKLDCTHRFIVEHKAILSPIRHVPPEVLQNIFIHTLPIPAEASFIMEHKSPRISQLPWALSQVCRFWRVIILSLSVMWRDLPVVDLHNVYTKEKRYLDFLTEILKRSSNTPIRFVILGNGSDHIGHPAIDMLVLHSDRWQKFGIHALPTLLPAFRKIKGRLSSLQSLSLGLYYAGSTDSINDTIGHDFFRMAPQLRYIELTGSTTKFIFPTHQLFQYCHTDSCLNDVIPVIFSSPSLRILRLSGFQEAEANTLPTTALTFPDLTILDAYLYRQPLFHEAFFKKLILPAIEELRVETKAENFLTPIYSMILRSGSPCLLRVLHLPLRSSPGELSNLLSLTPLLTNLSTNLPPIQDIFALLLDGSTPPLVPLLDECKFVTEYNIDPSTEIIQALNLFASSRCELPDDARSAEMLLPGEFHPLQTLCICFGWRSGWYRQQLQGWVYSDVADELYRQREHLRAMVPVLGCPGIRLKRKLELKQKFDSKWKNRVTSLLTHLETLEIEKASDICMSGIQYLLYAISIWFKKGDMEFSVSLIAERILNKWEPIFRDDMRNLHWLSTGLSLKYLSTTQNHALSSSPDAIKFCYYGVDADTSRGASNSYSDSIIFRSMQHDTNMRHQT